MNILFLTCANKEEAQSIAKSLLEKKLIVCAKFTNVESQFLWKGSLDKAEEVLLIMESDESKFNDVEKTIKEIHSYEQFVLVGFPITQMASGVQDWLKTEMGL